MTDPEVTAQLALLNQKIDAIHTSVEKTRKYVLWNWVSQLVMILLPLIALAIAIPWVISTFTRSFEGLL